MRKKSFGGRSGVILEFAVIFMIVTFALCAVIITYSASIVSTTKRYTGINTSKVVADAIAAEFAESPDEFDGSKYGNDYIFVKNIVEDENGFSGTLDVFYYSKLVECVQAFLENPVKCLNTYSFSTVSGYTVRVVTEVNPSGPSLEIYAQGSMACILKIYTQQMYDEQGLPIKESGYFLYQPYKLSSSTLIPVEDNDGNVEFNVVWNDAVDYSFAEIRSFYRANVDGFIFLTLKNGAFVQYEYGY